MLEGAKYVFAGIGVSVSSINPHRFNFSSNSISTQYFFFFSYIYFSALSATAFIKAAIIFIQSFASAALFIVAGATSCCVLHHNISVETNGYATILVFR